MNPLFDKVKGFRSVTLFKRNSSTVVFLWTLWNFQHAFFTEYSRQLLLSAEKFNLWINYYSSKRILLEEQLVDSSHDLILIYLSVCFSIQNLNLCSAVLASPNIFTMEIKDWRSLMSARSTNKRASAEHLMNRN